MSRAEGAFEILARYEDTKAYLEDVRPGSMGSASFQRSLHVPNLSACLHS